MTDFGGELHRVLAERGISLSAAAREAGCSKGYLCNAANGPQASYPRVAAGLDRLFGTDGTFAAYALVPPARQQQRSKAGSPHTAGTASETPARPRAARSTRVSVRKTANGAAHGDSAVEEPADAEEERLGYALAHPAGADLMAVAHLREQVRRLDEQYDRSPAAALIGGTGQCLGQIGFLRAHARRACPGPSAGALACAACSVSYLLPASLRCQASSVAGVMGKISAQRLRGRSRASAANHTRSAAGNAPGRRAGAAPRSRAGAPAAQHPWPGRRRTPGRPGRVPGTSAGIRS